jgi:peptide/nickel transport system permease protein
MPVIARSTINIPRLRKWRAQLNAPLVIGSLLLTVLVVCALAAPMLAPHDPFAVTVGAPGEPGPPYPPLTPGYLLGSDPAGRDMLSRLIYGGRYTLLFCITAGIMRMVVGLPLGMIAGWYERAEAAIGVVVNAWSAVPSLLTAAIIITVLGRRVGTEPLTIPFLIALSVTGWTEIASRCQVAVQELRVVSFIDAAYTIGGRRWSILWRHVLPNIRSVLTVEFAAAVAGALQLIAELGFLSLFVGGGQEDIFGSIYPDPIIAEWGSMFAKGLRQRSMGAWIVLEPLLALVLAILACNLLAEGLRRRFPR